MNVERKYYFGVFSTLVTTYPAIVSLSSYSKMATMVRLAKADSCYSDNNLTTVEWW